MLVLTVVAPRQPAGWLQCRVTVLFTVSDGAVQTQKVSAGGRQYSRILAREPAIPHGIGRCTMMTLN
jgi:hypothetical protein